jgi:hypothetical protein
MLNDIGLNKICSNCLLIEYLDIDFITLEGLNNIHCLIHLKSLFLSGASDEWLAKLSHSTALTQLDLHNSTVSDEVLLQLSSLQVMLASVSVNGRNRFLRK